MTRSRSEIAILVIVAALHLVIGGVHQYAHAVTEVENTPLEVLFIVLVVTIAPWGGIWLAWRRNLTKGAVLFSVSMLASLVFGLTLHFVLVWSRPLLERGSGARVPVPLLRTRPRAGGVPRIRPRGARRNPKSAPGVATATGLRKGPTRSQPMGRTKSRPLGRREAGRQQVSRNGSPVVLFARYVSRAVARCPRGNVTVAHRRPRGRLQQGAESCVSWTQTNSKRGCPKSSRHRRTTGSSR